MKWSARMRAADTGRQKLAAGPAGFGVLSMRSGGPGLRAGGANAGSGAGRKVCGVQHEHFPGGHPSQYHSRPSKLNFAVLMGSGAAVLVLSHLQVMRSKMNLTKAASGGLRFFGCSAWARTRAGGNRRQNRAAGPAGFGESSGRSGRPVVRAGGANARSDIGEKSSWGATRGLPRRSPIPVLLSPKHA
jgi:hypothetical protein